MSLNHPVNYQGSPAAMRRDAPPHGKHSREILKEVGLSDEEIAELST